jgi:DNA-binding MarR family transcriptional regulator
MHSLGTEAEAGRAANLLGTLALAVSGDVERALREEVGLGASDAGALITLRNYAEGETIDFVRGVLGLSQPGAVRLVDRLAQRGLVERGRSERDARAVSLRLTRSGRGAADRAIAARRRVLEPALEPLDDTERAALTSALEKLLAFQTSDGMSANHLCRLCDPDVCGHPGRCPVTQAIA